MLVGMDSITDLCFISTLRLLMLEFCGHLHSVHLILDLICNKTWKISN